MKYTVFSLLLLLFVSGIANAQAPQEIRYGQTASGEITKGVTSFEYAFDAAADDEITITATAANPDDLVLVVILSGPDGAEIERSNRGVLEGLILTEDGTHFITVEAIIGVGQFSLSLNRRATELDDRFVLFTENFDDNSAGWELQTQPGFIVIELVDGVAHMEHTPDDPGGGWFTTPGFEGWNLAPIFTDEFYYTVEVDHVTSSNGRYALGLYFAVMEDYEGYQYFTINQYGHLRYYENSEYSDYTFLDDEAYVPSVDFTDGPHTLGLYVIGDDYYFEIDGEIVYQYEDDFTYGRSGTIGFILSADDDALGSLTADFDNVIVRALSGEQRREARSFTNGCMVEAIRGTVNINTGTATDYPRAGTLEEDIRARVIGQAEGEDGLMWWQLSEMRWVRSDLVIPVTGCSSVPIVDG